MTDSAPPANDAAVPATQEAADAPPPDAALPAGEDDDDGAANGDATAGEVEATPVEAPDSAEANATEAAAAAAPAPADGSVPPPPDGAPPAAPAGEGLGNPTATAAPAGAAPDEDVLAQLDSEFARTGSKDGVARRKSVKERLQGAVTSARSLGATGRKHVTSLAHLLTLTLRGKSAPGALSKEGQGSNGGADGDGKGNGGKKKKKKAKKKGAEDDEEFDPYAEDEESETEEQKKIRKRRERAEQKARELDASKSPEEKGMDEHLRKLQARKKKVKKEIQKLGLAKGPMPNDRDFLRTAEFMERRLFREDELETLAEAHEDIPSTPEETEDQKTERLKRKKLAKMKQADRGGYPAPKERLKYKHKVLQPLSLQMKREVYHDFKLENLWDDEIFIDENLDEAKTKILLDLGFTTEDLYDEETGDPIEYSRKELKEMVRQRNIELQYRLGEPPARKWRTDKRFLGERGSLAKSLTPGGMMTDEDYEREDDEMYERYSDGYAMWVEQQRWDAYYEALAGALEEMLQVELALYDQKRGAIGGRKIIEKRLKTSLSPRSRLKLKDRLYADDENAFPMPDDSRQKELAQRRKEAQKSGMRGNDRPPPPPPLPRRDFYEKTGAAAVVNEVATPKSEADMSDAEVEIRNDIAQELEDYLLANADCYDEFDSPMLEKIANFGYYDMKEDPQSSTNRMARRQQKVKSGFGLGLGSATGLVSSRGDGGGVKSMPSPMRGLARTLTSSLFKEGPPREEGSPPESDEQGMNTRGRKSMNLVAYTGAKGGKVDRAGAFSQVDEMESSQGAKSKGRKKDDDSDEDEDEDAKGGGKKKKSKRSKSGAEDALRAMEGRHAAPPPDWERSPHHNFRREGNHYQEKNEEDEDEVDNEADQDAAIQEAFLVSQAEVSGEENDTGSVASGSQTMNRSRSVVHKTSSGGLAVIQEEDQDGEAGGGPHAIDENETGGPGQMRRGPPRPDGSFEDGTRSMLEQSSSVLGASGEFDPSLVIGPDGRPVDPQPGGKIVRGATGTDEPTANPLEQSQQQLRVNAEGFLIDSNDNLVRGEDGQPVRPVYPGDIYAEDYDGAGTGRVDGGYEQASSSSGSLGDPQEVRLKWSPPLPENPDAEYRLPKPPLALSVDLDGAIKKIKMTKELHAQALEKEEKYGTKKINRHAPNAKRFLQYKHEIGQIVRKMKYKLQEGRVKQYKKKLQKDPPPKTNVRDPSSWVKIFHFDTMTTSYWRYEAYNFVLHAMDASVDVIPVNKRNFEVFQAKVAAGEKRKREEEAEEAEEERQRQAERAPKLRRRISFNEDVEQADRDIFEGEHDRSPDGDADYEGRDFFANAFRHPNAEALGFQEDVDGDYYHEDGRVREDDFDTDDEYDGRRRRPRDEDTRGLQLQRPPDPHAAARSSCSSSSSAQNKNRRRQPVHYEGSHRTADVSPPSAPLPPPIPHSASPPAVPFGNSAASSVAAGSSGSRGSSGQPSFGRKNSVDTMFGASGKLKRVISNEDEGKTKDEAFVAKMTRTNSGLRGVSPESVQRMSSYARLRSFGSSASLSSSGRGSWAGQEPNLKGILKQTMSRRVLPGGQLRKFAVDLPFTEALWGEENVRFGGSFSPEKDKKLLVHEREEKTSSWGGKSKATERKRFDYKAKMKRALLKIKLLRGMGSSDATARQREEEQRQMMVLPKALVAEKFLDEKKALTDAQTLEDRRETANVIRHEIEAKITAGMASRRPKRRSSFHVLDPFTGLPLIETDGDVTEVEVEKLKREKKAAEEEKKGRSVGGQHTGFTRPPDEHEGYYTETDSEQEVEVKSPDPSVKQRLVRRREGHIRPGSREAVEKEMETLSDDEEAVDMPVHKRLLTVNQLKGTAQYYAQMKKAEEEQAVNVYEKVKKRREVKDGVKLASNAVVVPGADSQSEDELERKKRIMSRKSRRKFKKVRVSLRERMKERQLQSNENMMETMCAFVEISGETREVMLRQLLGHRKILPGEASRAKPSCCFISYRFFSLLEVISSLEVSARMTEERYLELFCGMTDGVSVQRNLQIGSVAVTSRIREILDLAGHDPKPPVTSSLSTKLDTGNWDNGDRLARYREFNPFEERIVLDEWDNLKLEVVPAGEGVERKLTKLAVKEKRLLQQQDEHYVYVPKEANEKVRLDFLVELTKMARDSWGEARRKFEHVRAYIDQQVPKVRRDLEKPIIVDVFDAVRDEIERTVQQDRLIDLERLEMEREFHKMRVARRKRQDEERKEERRRKREAKKLAKTGHGELHEAAKGKYGNPYSNVDPDPDINFDKGVIGGKSWEEAQRLAGRVSDALLSGTDASSLMRTLETVPGVNYDDPRRRESVLQNKTLEELEDECDEQKDDLSPMARRQKQHIISLTRMRRFLVGAFYTNSFFQPGNSIGYFLTYQADGAGSQVIFDRRRAAEFVSLYLEVDAPSQTLEYFSNYQDTLEKMLQDKSGKIVQTANSAFDRILRQLTLAKELIAAADVLGIPDPEQEVKRLRQERKLRRAEEDEYQETRRAAGPGDDTPFEEEVEEEEEDSPDEEEESTDLDSTEDDGDEEEDEKDFDLSILLPPIHPQSELNEQSLRREEVERKLSEKPRGKMILNPATNKEILAAPRGMKKRQQKAMVLMRESQRRAQDRAAITIPDMLDSPEVQSSRPGSPERTLEFSQIAETADLAIPVDPVLLKRERRAREREQIERDALKKSKKGTKKDLAKMIGTGEVSHDGVGASRSQMSRSRGHGEEEEDVDDLDFDFSNDDLDFSKMQKSRNPPKKGVDGGGGSVVPFRRDDNDDDDEYGEEEEFGSLFDDESEKEGPLEEIVEAADSSSCASDYPGERQELDYQATIGEETRTLVAQEALRDSKNGGAILAQDIQALLALAKIRQRTSKLLDVNLKKLQVPSAARKLAIFEHWNPNLDPNPRSLLGLVAFHYFSPPKFYQTVLEAKKEDTLVVHPLSAHLEEIAEQKNKGPPRLVSNASSASSAPVPLVSPEKHNKNSSSTNTDEMLGTGSSLSAVVQLYGAPAGHGTADHENQPDNEQRPPLLETDEARSCNRYLYDVAKSQDPFAKVFQDIVEDLCVKMMRFEHRHVGFELVAQAFPTNLDFASGSRTDQADMICLLAICKLATVFAATGR